MPLKQEFLKNILQATAEAWVYGDYGSSVYVSRQGRKVDKTLQRRHTAHMKRTLNIKNIEEAMTRQGLNQAQLSTKIGVSRAAVSNWFKGDDYPRPDKLLKLGLSLNIDFRHLVCEEQERLDPVIAFRKKRGRKTTDEHLDRAKQMGVLLNALVPYLSMDTLSRPAILRAPENEYGYLQRVSSAIRRELHLSMIEPVHFRHLVGHFAKLHAIIIPVLWGYKEHHENALHVYLPESMTTWVYLNLDSKNIDFNFWMAHELGHVLAPDLRNETAEDFADGFAQALLFPEESASRLYQELQHHPRQEGSRIRHIVDTARFFNISPTTISLALRAYAKTRNLPRLDAEDSIYAVTTNLSKDAPSISDSVFTTNTPSPREYMSVAREVFESPFFEAMSQYVRQADVSVGFIETVLQIPLLDAREIIQEL